MSELVHNWSLAEDDLLLRFLHVSQPGGKFEGSRAFATWLLIAENMSREAPRVDFARPYSRDLCAMRYSRSILPRLILAAAQNRLGRGPTIADASNAEAGPSGTNGPYESVLRWIADLRLPEDSAIQPEDTALANLAFWNHLLEWAANIVERPEQIFNAGEEGTLLEFDASPEVAPADDNPWGIRAQYELDFFDEILDWAENIVRQNEEDEQNQRSS